MAGLYLRHDAALQAVAEMGIDSTVGRPLLYQAHASTLTPSLIDKSEYHPTELPPAVLPAGPPKHLGCPWPQHALQPTVRP